MLTDKLTLFLLFCASLQAQPVHVSFQSETSQFLTLDLAHLNNPVVLSSEPNPSFLQLGERMPLAVPISPPWGNSVAVGYMIEPNGNNLRRTDGTIVGPLGFDVQSWNGFAEWNGQLLLLSPNGDSDDHTSIFIVSPETGHAILQSQLPLRGIVTGMVVAEPAPSTLVALAALLFFALRRNLGACTALGA